MLLGRLLHPKLRRLSIKRMIIFQEVSRKILVMLEGPREAHKMLGKPRPASKTREDQLSSVIIVARRIILLMTVSSIRTSVRSVERRDIKGRSAGNYSRGKKIINPLRGRKHQCVHIVLGTTLV